MLRHYDAIGLLRPAHVDPSSGYRFYKAAQLSRLNRVVALKDLGFTLQQVQMILDEDVTAKEPLGMLRLLRRGGRGGAGACLVHGSKSARMSGSAPSGVTLSPPWIPAA